MQKLKAVLSTALIKEKIQKFCKIRGTFLFIAFIVVYNVLISAAQQSDSVIHTHIYTFFKKIFFSIMVYHRILTIVLWDTQQDLAIYYSLHLLTPTSHSIPPQNNIYISLCAVLVKRCPVQLDKFVLLTLQIISLTITFLSLEYLILFYLVNLPNLEYWT